MLVFSQGSLADPHRKARHSWQKSRAPSWWLSSALSSAASAWQRRLGRTKRVPRTKTASGTSGRGDGTAQPEDPKVEEPTDQEAPEQAQAEAQAEAKSEPATFARTSDATPTHLLAASVLAAGALALIARKRLAA